MGLDVANALFRNLHLSWGGTRVFSEYCFLRDIPYPFIGWGGLNDGDKCRLGRRRKHTGAAREWCAELEVKCPEVAKLGKELAANPPEDLYRYLYPGESGTEEKLSRDEWCQRVMAAWYAILQHGITYGDTLEYW